MQLYSLLFLSLLGLVFALTDTDLLIDINGKHLKYSLPKKIHDEKHGEHDYLKIRAILKGLQGKLKATIRAKKLELDVIAKQETEARKKLHAARHSLELARSHHEQAHEKLEDVHDSLLLDPPLISSEKKPTDVNSASASAASTPLQPKQQEPIATPIKKPDVIHKKQPMNRRHRHHKTHHVELETLLKKSSTKHNVKHGIHKNEATLKLKLHKQQVKKAQVQVSAKIKELKKAHREFKQIHKHSFIKKKHAIIVIDKCISDLKISQTILRVLSKRKAIHQKAHAKRMHKQALHKKHDVKKVVKKVQHKVSKKIEEKHSKEEGKKQYECTCLDCKQGCEHFEKCKQWCERVKCNYFEHKITPVAAEAPKTNKQEDANDSIL